MANDDPEEYKSDTPPRLFIEKDILKGYGMPASALYDILGISKRSSFDLNRGGDVSIGRNEKNIDGATAGGLAENSTDAFSGIYHYLLTLGGGVHWINNCHHQQLISDAIAKNKSTVTLTQFYVRREPLFLPFEAGSGSRAAQILTTCMENPDQYDASSRDRNKY